MVYGAIPADFDDSAVNLGYGSLLAEMKDMFRSSYDRWMEINPDLTTVTEAMKTYAYRPFATNDPTNAIDPRSYFAVRQSLQKAKAENKDVRLITTWVRTIISRAINLYSIWIISN